jgi:hypothetical protein
MDFLGSFITSSKVHIVFIVTRESQDRINILLVEKNIRLFEIDQIN